ncbi:complex I intermediate-associated protein 30-domain-containing protein [Penicillium alfredii]|uniref:Complex I intermediate-associated protein 30-domain-containing protein n=1 Tax=Penicillium alfredii TaxID=1506179 RepID=A0A9W9GA11_9EURO|nr:complex I intermediate-associated protein 30-domain-containing protein [Penicillium alfredii]KAJ5114247.1 complex I intermediate-associated protein 30-domain-containing protein [Penicillium alfredii]
MSERTTYFPLFGGPREWAPNDWTASDDHVRGGSSHSILTCCPDSSIASFHGNLDVTTLGGAGFASQRTTGQQRLWDLSNYDGLELAVNHADGKLYTITLKNEILPKRPDGREQSTLSWEYDFRSKTPQTILIRWDDFKPTYRGKKVRDTKPLDPGNVKRVSIMIRSFFGEQQGEFSLEIVSLAGFRIEHYLDDPEKADSVSLALDGKTGNAPETRKHWGVLAWLGQCFGSR